MKLSIIVPVYNVESYLRKCLDSLSKQNLSSSEYEVLVFNDGSTDYSGQIAFEYCSSHSTIFSYYEHPNRGLSGTRNRGIEIASGEYIWFVDSDDWIEENCLSSIIKELKNGEDVLSFNGFIPEGGRKEGSKFYNDDVCDKQSFFRKFTDPAQFYIFRREFLINNLCRFKEGIKHEDTLFTPITLAKAESIVFYRTPSYHFLQREGSITRVVDYKRIIDLANNLEILCEYSDHINDRMVKIGFLNHVAHKITEMLNYGIDNEKKGEDTIDEIMKEHPIYWDIMRNAIDLKPRLIYWLIKLSPASFVTTYRMLAKFR